MQFKQINYCSGICNLVCGGDFQDLAAIEGGGDALDRLIEQLRLWHGVLRVEPDQFSG